MANRRGGNFYCRAEPYSLNRSLRGSSVLYLVLSPENSLAVSPVNREPFHVLVLVIT